MRVVQHLFHVLELEEDHELDREEGVVLGADLAHVVVGLVRDHPQLLEPEENPRFD